MGNTKSRPTLPAAKSRSATNSSESGINMALRLCEQVLVFERLSALDVAINFSRSALDRCGTPSHPRYVDVLSNLILCLHVRSILHPEMHDQDELITLRRQFEAIPLHRSGPSHSMNFNHLALTLRSRFKASGKVEDLDNAVTYSREAVLSCSPDNDHRPIIFSNLASSLFDRFNILGKAEDLDEAIASFRNSLLCPSEIAEHSDTLSSLTLLLSTRFKRSDKMEDLEEAIEYGHQALAACPLEDTKRASALGNLAFAIHTRYKQLGITNDLDEAIKYSREAIVLRPPGSPDRFFPLNNFSQSLLERFRLLSKVGDLDGAIDSANQALAACPPGDAQRPLALGNLAVAIHTRYEQLGDINDLDKSIEYNREATHLQSPSSPDRFFSLNNFSQILLKRFRLLSKMEDLEEAIDYGHQALAACPLGHTQRAVALGNLGLVINIRYKQLGIINDLDKCIEYSRDAVLLQSPGPDRSSPLSIFSKSLLERFRLSSKMVDLEEAIEYSHQALAACPLGDTHRSSTLSILAVALHTRYKQLGDINDLDKVIEYNREATHLQSPSSPDRFFSLSNVSHILLERFRLVSKMEDLEEAIDYSHQALAACPVGHTERALALGNLAVAIHTRYKQLGIIDDLNKSIEHSREAIPLRPPGSPDRIFPLNNVSQSLLERFHLLSKMEDLDDAIDYAHQALVACPPGDAQRTTALSTLGLAIHIRYKQLGNTDDLDKVIQYNRETLLLELPGRPDRFFSHNNIAMALHERFHRLGKMDDLENAISYSRKALAACGPGNTSRASAFSNLAFFIHSRYEQVGTSNDLDEAVEYNREALRLRPPGNPDRFFSVNNLATMHLIGFSQRSKKEDLVTANKYMLEALALCRPGNTMRTSALSNFSSFLRQYSQQLKEISGLDDTIKYGEEALDDAVKYGEEALSLCHGHVDRWQSLDCLARALSSRFELLDRVNDLKNAVAYHSEAKTSLPSNHPAYALLEVRIASTYLLEYRTNHTPENLTMAFDLLQSAANHPTASSMARLQAALAWVSNARKHKHASILHAYSQSFVALDRCLAMRLSLESQQILLAEIPRSLASEAAACVIADGDLKKAVELLEQGRAIVWARLRGYRHSLEELHQVDSKLAQEFRRVSALLEQYATSSDFELKVSAPVPEPVGPAVSPDEKIKQHRILSEQWNEIVSLIREKEGFADFLRPVPFATLQRVADDGPVIIVNISKDRSDAIILLPDNHPLVLVPLPTATPECLAGLFATLSDARARDAATRCNLVYGILRDLWYAVVLPVKDKLLELNVAKKSRIWWCPTSKLCGLPVHAAGPYLPGHENLSDCYISSYTSSLSALISARSDVPNAVTIPKMLIIGQPSALLSAGKEILTIQEYHAAPTILLEENATPESVVSSLRQHSWTHFACHGIQHPQPYKSSFILHENKHLTLRELIQARLPAAELAFLSACHTASGDLDGTPDEVIHLAAALQFCGFRSVVGTLWAMADSDAPDLARDFYKHMLRPRPKNFREAAIALNKATRQMRARKGDRKVPVDRWVNFVHIGA